jgi:two-component system nitrogen regulation sensor histidine kinase NtrY
LTPFSRPVDDGGMIFRDQRLEKLKRRREKRAAFLIAIVLILSVIVHALVERKSEKHRLVESLTYLSVTYFYIFIGILLFILLARNLLKSYIERKSGQLGSSLKWKIVFSLVTFSLIPSVVFFIGATALIRSGFEQYFGDRVASALEDSESIVKTHYDRIQRDLDLMASQAAKILKQEQKKDKSKNIISTEVFNALPLSRLEIYKSPTMKPEVFTHFEKLPATDIDLVERAFKGEAFRQTKRVTEGDLIQRFQPFSTKNGVEVLVLSQSVPQALFTRMEELKSTLVVYRETRTLKNSLKTQYSIVLLVLFVLVLFVVTWFGIYITREITDPVMELLEATNAFRSGKWDFRIKSVGSITPSRGKTADLEILKSAFNLMAEEVGTRGKKLEEVVMNLEGRERYLETLLSSIRRGVVVLSPEGKIQRINREALELLTPDVPNPSTEAYKESAWSEVFKIYPKERFDDFLRAVKIKRGQHLDQVFEVKRDPSRDLPPLSLRATGVLLFDFDNRDLGTLLIVEDISDATRMERLAAWQGVARRVAHEIKNPLTPISISADRILRKIMKLPEDHADLDVFKECVAQIQKQVRVIRDLVKDFGQFAKLPEPRFEKVQLSELFEGFLKDYRFTHPDVAIFLDKKTEDLIQGDPELLRILFINMVDNAVHSLQERRSADTNFKGALKITIEDSSKNSFLKIVFEDNGAGVDPELRDKIFDPYISSKASGMGLGLAIVRRIAEEHLGSVSAEPAEGARFVFELPRYPSSGTIQLADNPTEN